MSSEEYHHRVYRVSTTHSRLLPVQHGFTYPLFYFGINLDHPDELISNDTKSSISYIFSSLVHKILWGHNRLALFSIRDSDYLSPLIDDTKAGIKEKLLDFIFKESGHCPQYSKIELVTTPRVLGYSFNPVSFYFCYVREQPTEDAEVQELLKLVIYEVHNTFGERHLYFLTPPPEGMDREGLAFRRKFHVSPFNDRSGKYKSYLVDPQINNRLYVRLNILAQEKKKFMAEVHGPCKPATPLEILSCFITYPFNAVLVFPRIIYQAYILHYIHALPVYNRPTPDSSSILFLPPSHLEKYCLSQFRILISKISEFANVDFLILTPGNRLNVQNEDRVYENDSPLVIINLHSYDLVTSLVYNIESDNFLPVWCINYMTGSWTSNNIPLLLNCMIRYQCARETFRLPNTYIGRLFTKICHYTRMAGNLKSWNESARLSRPFLDRFRAHAALEYPFGNSSQNIESPDGPSRFLLADSLKRASHNNGLPGFYILAFPLHRPITKPDNRYFQALQEYNPIDLMVLQPFENHKGLFRPIFPLIFHVVFLMLGILFQVLDIFVFSQIATFHPMGNPKYVIKKYYTHLHSIINNEGRTAFYSASSPPPSPSPLNESISNKILGFCFHSNCNIAHPPASPPGHPWISPKPINPCKFPEASFSEDGEFEEQERVALFLKYLWKAISKL